MNLLELEMYRMVRHALGTIKTFYDAVTAAYYRHVAIKTHLAQDSAATPDRSVRGCQAQDSAATPDTPVRVSGTRYCSNS